MRLARAFLLSLPVVVAGLSGCSNDSSSSSSTVTLKVQVGQEDIEFGVIRSVPVLESGLLSEDAEGRLNATTYVSDEEGLAEIPVASAEIQLFEVIGRVTDTDTTAEGTTQRCQWVAGCSVDGNDYVFGADMLSVTGLGWQSVVYDGSSGEQIRVTPLTDLAAQLAFSYVYAEDLDTPQWVETGYYSAYSVEQALSQVAILFGLDSVQSREPADLTQISEWRSVNASSQYSIRYGALVAAWKHLVEDNGQSYADAVVAEFIADKGQLLEKGTSRTLALYDLYDLAATNLQAVSVSNSKVQSNIQAVVSGLQAEMAGFESDVLTSVAPASLSSLLGQSEYEDFVLGIQRTKAFITLMKDYGNNFFEDGYKEQLQAYLQLVDSVGDEHAENLNTVVQSYREIAGFYYDCYLAGACPTPDVSWAWLTSVDSYNAATAVLTLNGGELRVAQQVADVNTTDDDDEPTSSHAIDVMITGQVSAGNLRFEIDNAYENDDPDNDITSTSGVRYYFTNEVSALEDAASNEILGYELRWSDFALYDVTTVGTATETEVTGSFRLFYRGVRDPLNEATALHFNIDTVVLNGRISDVVGDDSEDDVDYSTVYVAGVAANASDYYPESEFASFNGFFNPNASADFTAGDIIAGLLTYQTGTETVGSSSVQYLDVMLEAEGVALDDSRRYRFYPTVAREDENDIDGDDDTDEIIYTHDLEICDLTESAGVWAVSSCYPKQRLYKSRDMQQAINDLWEAGAFSRVEVPGRGTYFVEWPVNAADSQGCLSLETLSTTATSFDGVLYDPVVLGLTNLRFTSEVLLEDEPATLLDVSVAAEDSERYTVVAALSHDYSGLTSDEVYLGTGSALDRVVVSYDGDSNFSATGSLSVFKDGVSLSLDDGTSETIDSSLTAFLNQEFDISPLPYEYIDSDSGGYELCVKANQAEWTDNTDTDSAVYHLNFRDVVYGRIANESGAWIIRYIDGTWETL